MAVRQPKPHRIREGDSTELSRGEAQYLRDQDGAKSTGSTATGEKLKADIDDLLDEIDEVLETNAEDFVRSYVQKGGE